MAIQTNSDSFSKQISMSVSRRRSFAVWAAICILAGVLFLLYVFTSMAAGRGELLMPMDDVYIHFQYAHQLVSGQLYIYNPGLPPSSGATSLLYPYVLAFGDLIGFKGLTLGLWALGIGALALVGSTWLIYQLGGSLSIPWWIRCATCVAFMLTGAVSWHYLSGMETGLMIFSVLLALTMVVNQQYAAGMWSAALLTLIRPEGAVLGLMAAGVLVMQHYRRLRLRDWMVIAIPISGAVLQPLINILITGSAVASGNQAKSILSIIPADQELMISRIVENFVRLWVEFATGISLREGVYISWFIPAFALLGLIALVFIPKQRLTLLLVTGWLISGTLAVATLDPAFWHFKRYQMPFIALFFPLAGWGSALLWRQMYLFRVLTLGLWVVTAAGVVASSGAFLQHFALNVGYVADQPLQMARWLYANTAENTAVAVHDVGLIRYLSGRTTVDMVGLTTAGAADAWRNGPGSVAEFLETTAPRPEYIASYNDARGLSYLANTSIYGTALVLYTVPISDQYNVALAAAEQGIFRVDWSLAALSYTAHQTYPLAYLGPDATPLDTVDVADLNSEAAHSYIWSNGERLPGFATEVYENDYVACVEMCRVLDGGRRINGVETFTLSVPDKMRGQELVLITRVHAAFGGTFDVEVNGQRLGTREVPLIPGRWLEIPTHIPGVLATDALQVRITAHTPSGHYMPYMHLLYTLAESLPFDSGDPVSTFAQDTITLQSADYAYAANMQELHVDLNWTTAAGATGDAVSFVHVYTDDGELAAQADLRPGQGAMPPANWIPGFSIQDRVVVNLAALVPGRYRVALGLYDPITGIRLAPTGGDKDNRFWLGELEIPPYE